MLVGYFLFTLSFVVGAIHHSPLILATTIIAALIGCIVVVVGDVVEFVQRALCLFVNDAPRLTDQRRRYEQQYLRENITRGCAVFDPLWWLDSSSRWLDANSQGEERSRLDCRFVAVVTFPALLVSWVPCCWLYAREHGNNGNNGNNNGSNNGDGAVKHLWTNLNSIARVAMIGFNLLILAPFVIFSTWTTFSVYTLSTATSVTVTWLWPAAIVSLFCVVPGCLRCWEDAEKCCEPPAAGGTGDCIADCIQVCFIGIFQAIFQAIFMAFLGLIILSIFLAYVVGLATTTIILVLQDDTASVVINEAYKHYFSVFNHGWSRGGAFAGYGYDQPDGRLFSNGFDEAFDFSSPLTLLNGSNSLIGASVGLLLVQVALSYLAALFGACARVPNVNYRAVLQMTSDDRVSREVAMVRRSGAVPLDRPVAPLSLPDPDDVPVPVDPRDVPEAVVVALPSPAIAARI